MTAPRSIPCVRRCLQDQRPTVRHRYDRPRNSRDVVLAGAALLVALAAIACLVLR